MTCAVCGCDINYGEDFREHEDNKEDICMNPECLHKHMLEHITMSDLEEYSASEPKLQEQITMNGLSSLSAEETDALVEWYSQLYHTCENDMPDDRTVAQWAADLEYQNTEYSRMAI